MKETLRNLIENDIDRTIDNKEIDDKNFFVLILYYLLDNDRLDLIEINTIANELSAEYKSFLEDFNIELAESNGEIIKVLKSAIPNFNKRIANILYKIRELKKNGSN